MLVRRLRLLGWETPLALLGVVILSYGLWIPWFGLFGNDLSYLWYYHLLGPWGPAEFAAIDRPASGLFYAAVTFLFGETVWPYHVLLLILRWLSAVLLWWVLGLVWPAHKREAAVAALLFAVYPGFRQNPVALEFILHFYVLDLFLLSLGTMLLSICQPKRYWPWALWTGLGAAGMFSLEYFIGLEILRPIFLWIVTRREGLTGRRQGKQMFKAWLPALVIVLAFLVWRVFIFSFPTYRPVLLDALRTSPLSALTGLTKTVARDLWTALVGAWRQTVMLPDGRRSLVIFLAVALASAVVVALLWRRLVKLPEAILPQAKLPPLPRQDAWGETALGIGLLAMLAGGSIFWVTGIPVTLEFPWDRSTLSLMLGASLAIAGLLEMTVTARYRPVVLAGLVALAVGMHFVNAQEYRAEWQKLQDFSWQLTWRAPQLEPGTLALFDVIPLNRYSDNDLTALLNWTYAPDQHTRSIAYKFFDLTLRMDSGSRAGLPGLEKGLPVEHDARGTFFQTTTSSTLALTYNPPACLKILKPADAPLPGTPDRIAKVLPMTRIEQVRAAGPQARPPAQLGPEPAHGWCYYYQKAELARQQGDWTAVSTLGDQAFAVGLNPGDPAELLPFIEGYARGGDPAKARALNEQVGQQAGLRPALCQVWQRVGAAPGAALQGTAADIRAGLGCQP